MNRDKKVSALDRNFRFQQMRSSPALLVDVNLNVGKIGQLTFTWKSVVQSHRAKAGQTAILRKPEGKYQ